MLNFQNKINFTYYSNLSCSTVSCRSQKAIFVNLQTFIAITVQSPTVDQCDAELGGLTVEGFWSSAASVFVFVAPQRPTVTATQPHAVECQYDLKDQKATAPRWPEPEYETGTFAHTWQFSLLFHALRWCWYSGDLGVTLASGCSGGGDFDADHSLLSLHTLDLFLKFLLHSHTAAAAAMYSASVSVETHDSNKVEQQLLLILLLFAGEAPLLREWSSLTPLCRRMHPICHVRVWMAAFVSTSRQIDCRGQSEASSALPLHTWETREPFPPEHVSASVSCCWRSRRRRINVTSGCRKVNEISHKFLTFPHDPVFSLFLLLPIHRSYEFVCWSWPRFLYWDSVKLSEASLVIAQHLRRALGPHLPHTAAIPP